MTHPVIEKVNKLFDDRKKWQSLWDVAYEFMAPERAVFFASRTDRDPNTVMDRVYDSTAIDAAERLTNLVTSRLAPPWMKWFRLVPGPSIVDQAERTRLREPLELVENLMHAALARSNFYSELQPTVLDRVIGGTGALGTSRRAGKRVFTNIPLADVAMEDDEAGRTRSVGRKYKVPASELMRVYGDRLPTEWRAANGMRPNEKFTVYELTVRDALDDWNTVKMLESGGPEAALLEVATTPYPGIMPTRWAKVPGECYGRGPGLRALADVRALNRVKELTLKNAARAVAGVYTVVDDGVINPYTLSLEPMTFIPVSSNDQQAPTIAPLPSAGDLNTAAFVIEDLRAAIKGTFLADQFGPLDRTPMSATEVVERTRIIAQELGATVSRLQQELLLPVLRIVLEDLKADPTVRVPTEIVLDDDTFRVDFVSQLAQAQWAVEEQQITEFTMLAVQLGQVDPKAGLALDVHKTLRRLAEIKSVPGNLLRTDEEIEAMLEQAGAAAQQAQEEGVPLE